MKGGLVGTATAGASVDDDDVRDLKKVNGLFDLVGIKLKDENDVVGGAVVGVLEDRLGLVLRKRDS